MDEHNNETENDGAAQKGQRWVEENLRLIISIIIVIAIAAGIYSYSQRSQETQVAFDDDTQEQVLVDEESMDNGEDTSEAGVIGSGETQEDSVASDTEEPQEAAANEEASMQEESQMEEAPSTMPAETSKETSEAIIVKAQSGNGLTHLARQATAEYLTKNPDSQLTAAHKIYIEDYLRKTVGHQGGVRVGTEVSFSKGMIQDAIAQSKNLTESQLNNLQKYVVLVPSLS